LTRERLGQGAVGLSFQPITGDAMNSIIYLVGLIVVVLAILSFLGLR
jgi:LPXTG-motif cell wall-anchored protein